MENFDISAEGNMLFCMEGMDEHTNSIPIESSINTTDDPQNYSLSGNFVIESEYHQFILHC